MTKKTETKTEGAVHPAQEIPEAAVERGKEVAAEPRRRSLKEQLDARGVTPEAWHTLTGSVFPGAKIESVLLAVDYCRARKLDPLKRPCHIVPMQVESWDERARKKVKTWRDVILPGIYELRTTAHRTGEYLGHTPVEWGELVETPFGFEFPRSASMVVRRRTPHGVAEFPVTVYFEEVCGTYLDRDADKLRLNSKWSKSPRQMTAKCLEAAGLREAFPEELGGEYVAEEVETIEVAPPPAPPPATHGAATDADEMNRDLGLAADVAEGALEEMVDEVVEEVRQ